MRFKTRLEAGFKREYQNVEFLFRKRPGFGGPASFPPSVSLVLVKYLYFLATKISEKNLEDPDYVVVALMRLGDFVIKRKVRDLETSL